MNIADLVAAANGGNGSLWNAHTVLGIQDISADDLHAWYVTAVGHDGHIADLMYEYWTNPSGGEQIDWTTLAGTATVTGTGTEASISKPIAVSAGSTALVLVSWSDTAVTVTASTPTLTAQTAHQDNGADWRSRFYSVNVGADTTEFSVTFSAEVDYMMTVTDVGELLTFDAVNLQANASSTSCANAGITIGGGATYHIALAHRKGADTTWTDPLAGTLIADQSGSTVWEAAMWFEAATPGATGTLTSTMGSAAKSALLLVSV